MSYFAVHYTYLDDLARIGEHRPVHREFLRSLVSTGLVAAGAYPDTEPAGALLILTADSEAAVAALLDADPFRTEGLITDRRIMAWNPVVGIFEQ